jgi:hypothetical protein
MKIRKRVSAKKLAANRKNSSESTGPRTTAGKRRSSLNALELGFYSRDLKISDEDRPAFDAILNNLLLELEPSTTLQTIAVHQIRACYWRTELALELELHRLQVFFAPAESSSDEVDCQRDHRDLQWYGASKADLRAGVRLLSELRSEISQNGALHLAQWEDRLVNAFGVGFYNELQAWKPMDLQAIIVAESLVAHEKNFNLEPLPGGQPPEGVKIVVDEKQKWLMLLKLVDLKIQHLLDLRQVNLRTVAPQDQQVLTDFVPRYFAIANRELQRCVRWFLFLKSNGL